MTTYKYISADVVAVIDDDGISRMSGLASAVGPEGAEILPADPIPVPPIGVSPRQIRQALTAAGLRSAVEAGIAAGDQNLKDWWEFATAFEENHPMVIGMAAQLGQTTEQLHSLFELAQSL